MKRERGLSGRRPAGAAIAALAIGLAAASSVTARAQAKGPAFDCSRANGEVEKLICADEGLAALDRQLDGVYQAALARARDQPLRLLRAEQRGWVKGRDGCWKARGAGNEVYLTESWTADTVAGCVVGQYQLRIAELQVRYQLVPSRKPVLFACNDNPANAVVATFFETDPPAARFERGDQTVIGYRVRSASGARFEGQNLSFWSKGAEATVTWLDEALRCKAR